MKKIVFSLMAITVLLLSSNMFFSSTLSETISISSVTLTVDDDGPADYSCIQDAIDNASDDDTVFVYSGIYYENIIIDKSINLMGEDKNTTIIDGQGIKACLFFENSYIELSNFKLKNLGQYSGIYINSDNNNNVISNNIFIEDAGIAICSDSNYNQIIDNEFYNNDCTNINIRSKNNYVSRNIIEDYDVGIEIWAPDNVIYNNIINSGKNGILIVSCGSDNEISQNIISNNSDHGIFSQMQFNIITNNLIENNNIAIFLDYNMQSTISSNIIKGNNISLKTKEPYPEFENLYANITKNNFINNNECKFHMYTNLINNNYWDDWIGLKNNEKHFLKTLINVFCKIVLPITNPMDFTGKIPYHVKGTPIQNKKYLNLDWNPADEPFDIDTGWGVE